MTLSTRSYDPTIPQVRVSQSILPLFRQNATVAAVLSLQERGESSRSLAEEG